MISNLAEYGNTSAASIPLALDEAVRAGSVKPGDTVRIVNLDCLRSIYCLRSSARLLAVPHHASDQLGIALPA